MIFMFIMLCLLIFQYIDIRNQIRVHVVTYFVHLLYEIEINVHNMIYSINHIVEYKFYTRGEDKRFFIFLFEFQRILHLN